MPECSTAARLTDQVTKREANHPPRALRHQQVIRLGVEQSSDLEFVPAPIEIGELVPGKYPLAQMEYGWQVVNGDQPYSHITVLSGVLFFLLAILSHIILLSMSFKLNP